MADHTIMRDEYIRDHSNVVEHNDLCASGKLIYICLSFILCRFCSYLISYIYISISIYINSSADISPPKRQKCENISNYPEKNLKGRYVYNCNLSLPLLYQFILS